ncbi:alginate O-acetyltransferase complex protein AlgI [Cytobacillus eiseniae]|uniref:Alginate O-acetyltransferase complex protein AlgI n=1 Tax=Cytobacillus eiseniae TaxID=762947 RepID=A0ABS4RHH5_9BACI|nr:MBOAT family protein [Cytobacillus eiseniae]MBP2242347.1 alginate O-acetyltransferase complex protein AlgI [Cytobacillus eiseniae]
MVFSSSLFLFLFLPIVLLIYYLLKLEYRNIFLLVVSLLFYAWGEPKFVIVIIASIIINYVFGIIVHLCSENKVSCLIRRTILIVGIISNCGLLFYFKYYDFFLSSINSITGLNLTLANVILPIGISFFTFQGLSYVIDVYQGKIKVQKNLYKLALYMAFFPQLIAGPIVRYVDIHTQIDERVSTIDGFASGIRRFVIGLGKKVIIANTLGAVADSIFGLPAEQNSMAIAWVGAICYTFQIYFDFSGYSDMAIGLARMFGFNFKENFDYPYISKTVTEFWRRWHISLSRWFRDYLYIPLGGNRRGNVYVNLLIVFIVTGLWHGAAWNFIIWGLWHGLFLILERVLKLKKVRIRVPKIIIWSYTSLVVIIGWVLFRSPDLTYARDYIGIMFGLNDPYNVGFTVWYYLNPMIVTMLVIACICSIPIIKYIKGNVGSYEEHSGFSLFLQNAYVLIILIISIMFMATSTYNPFIYFRF